MNRYKDPAHQGVFKTLSHVDFPPESDAVDMVFPQFLSHAALGSKDCSAVLKRKLSSSYEMETTPTDDDSQESSDDFAHSGQKCLSQKKANGPAVAASADEVKILTKSPAKINQACAEAHTAGNRSQGDKTRKMLLELERLLREHQEPSEQSINSDHDRFEGGIGSEEQESTQDTFQVYDPEFKEGGKVEKKTPRATYNKYIGNILDDQARRMLFFLGGLD
jgi:hypothetical protein